VDITITRAENGPLNVCWNACWN